MLLVHIIIDNEQTSSEIIFFDCVEENNKFILAAHDALRYEITDVPKHCDLDLIKSVCDGRTQVTIQGKMYNDKNKEPYFTVRSITAEETEILPLKETNAIRRRKNFLLMMFPVGFLIIWSLVVFGSVKVGRNPVKYQKFVRLFFKPGYIKKNPVRKSYKKRSKLH